MIRFGIIGTNWITDRLIEAARQVEGFELTAVYSRTEEQGKSFQHKHSIPHLYTNLEQFAASKEFDAVYIASPNSLHAEQSILCMNHGKHVLCEKPVASNAREFEGMIEASRRNNVLLMEALKSTLQPNFKAIQDNLHKIGPVRRYFASFCQYSSRYDAYKEGTVMNAFKPELSNGSMMDIGIYCIYPMVVLFGKPEAVKASGVMLDSGVDGSGSLLVSYKDLDGMMMHSKITNSHVPSEIQGEKGSIMISKISQLSGLEIRYNDGTVESIAQPQVENTMFYEVQHFVELLQNGLVESPINTFANSTITLEIMDEARKQLGIVYPADSLSL
ncbi:Gfo/Idh/MocA family oxidoreductase [Paenibacillus sp. N1-5-1-14]|uniref:Gfo/Idh/MocA family protein n=1 Tax=Paenibacillus radicibacter TaxID=2972488 RepID=UPI0021599209|nr:Gfo/Idh/MocA family oxidoreductase [Paenibacillus radicibacter]MCR8644662.1 Gfo/Idh/MocA family oxidoreductase [Paenibacillus radicibacter]